MEYPISYLPIIITTHKGKINGWYCGDNEIVECHSIKRKVIKTPNGSFFRRVSPHSFAIERVMGVVSWEYDNSPLVQLSFIGKE